MGALKDKGLRIMIEHNKLILNENCAGKFFLNDFIYVDFNSVLPEKHRCRLEKRVASDSKFA